ncbi:P-loop containing nucleoside triphosphate hydrolase protein [Pyronema omphalodes]|nr:P-loop containing nucleoside triphosphate hydrolase protein [Pyronema omphalodes]
MASLSAPLDKVRIIARIRPVLGSEREMDIVVKNDSNLVIMPNPKNEKETFTFPFHAVYPMESDQAQIFAEVSPTLKHLFKGNDVTIFAYGVTGSGKTHTMKGNKAPAERGIIPRLLTAIYRRGKELEKKSNGELSMCAIMSYYEIYNDKVFDLFEAPNKRTLAGLPLREQHGKTHVVGLTEKEISTLKDFETLYDMANNNRSTSATMLNSNSSRSHAIICVRVEIKNNETGEMKIGTVSCIDLAGSEDNRRTANDKERMVESASINKSLFVLSQCVEAMQKKQNRIPYRESKMTRILSLGQNNGMTVMILNLAPTKKFHQDTLSALNFANRAKQIEVKNDPPPPPPPVLKPLGGGITGAPRREFGTNKTNTTGNRPLSDPSTLLKKPSKDFIKPSKPVVKPIITKPLGTQNTGIKKPSRSSDASINSIKARRANGSSGIPTAGHGTTVNLSNINIEEMVSKKVEEILAARALNETSIVSATPSIDDEVQRRLEILERKLEKKADARAEGLTYLVLAKQHVQRGEDFAALSMYRLALNYFPDNEKLLRNIAKLEARRREEGAAVPLGNMEQIAAGNRTKKAFAVFMDADSGLDRAPSPPRKRARAMSTGSYTITQTPRTQRLLHIINSEDVDQIMTLKVRLDTNEAELDCFSLPSLHDSPDDTSSDDTLTRGMVAAKKPVSSRPAMFDLPTPPDTPVERGKRIKPSDIIKRFERLHERGQAELALQAQLAELTRAADVSDAMASLSLGAPQIKQTSQAVQAKEKPSKPAQSELALPPVESYEVWHEQVLIRMW